MTSKPTIRPFMPDEWRTYKSLRLRALADSPEAFGSTLAKEQDRSEVEWASRLALNDETAWNLPLLAEVDGEPVGLAWGRIERANPKIANLYQMWVAPDHRRLGAGQMLLAAVIDWAREKGGVQLELGVTLRDSSAMRLYQRSGFEALGQPEPLRPGSELLCQSMRLILNEEIE